MGESLQMTKNEYKIDKVTFLDYNLCYITIIIIKKRNVYAAESKDYKGNDHQCSF